jgi:hypothetical protein
MDDKQRDREMALQKVIEYAECQGTPKEPYQEAALLRTCVPVEREYLDRLERAVYGFSRCSVPRYEVAKRNRVLMGLGFMDADGKVTPAAHDFARRMAEREKEQR